MGNEKSLVQIVNCAQCGGLVPKLNGYVNRAKKTNSKLFCGKVCFGLSRKNKLNLSDSEKKAAKKKYDAEYRAKNLEILKEKKSKYYKENRDPEKEKEIRKAKMHLHVEYCRSPEYKAKKAAHDRKKVLEKYGIFADAFILLEQVEKLLVSQASKYERLVQRGYFKRSSIERRRELCRLKSTHLPL